MIKNYVSRALSRSILRTSFAILIFLAACESGGLVSTSTPIIININGTPVSATPEPSTAPTATVSPTPANIPDLSGETIPLIYLCDKSGPLSGGNASRIAAVEDMVAAINADGGIFGAELDLHLADTLGTVEGAVRAETRMLRQYQDAPLVLVCDPVSEGALQTLVSEDEVPALSPGFFAEPGGFLFGLDASPAAHLAFWLQDLAANWADRQPQGAGDQIRLALLTWPSELSGQPASPELLADAADLGVEVVLQSELVPEEDANIFDFVYAARDANANVIYTNARSSGMASLLNALNDLGLADRFVVGAPAAAYDAQLYDYLFDPAYAQGLYLTSAWAWWSEDQNSGIEFASELLTRSSLEGDWTDWGYLQMAGAVDLARRALQDAILAEGYDDLSPASVASALDDLGAYTVLNGLYVVDYSSDGRTLADLRVWRAGALPGELKMLSDFAPISDPDP